MIIIFYGNGKGKSSAAAGIALRAWGQGKRVLYLAFLKSRNISGEFKAIQHINSPNLSLATFGRECPYLGQECCPGHGSAWYWMTILLPVMLLLPGGG